jgi:hypothetical protein
MVYRQRHYATENGELRLKELASLGRVRREQRRQVLAAHERKARAKAAKKKAKQDAESAIQERRDAKKRRRAVLTRWTHLGHVGWMLYAGVSLSASIAPPVVMTGIGYGWLMIGLLPICLMLIAKVITRHKEAAEQSWLDSYPLELRGYMDALGSNEYERGVHIVFKRAPQSGLIDDLLVAADISGWTVTEDEGQINLESKGRGKRRGYREAVRRTLDEVMLDVDEVYPIDYIVFR